ncbi:MAG: pirin family protein [Halothiobacillaceae bacterium]|nr:pirin family protein [Halothiobacillaceae bacterium]
MQRIVPVEMEEGQGARVKRLFPVPGLRHIDPFVLFDHFFLESGSGFPDHPHRGFEAVTYLLAGAMRHQDSLGNDSVVGVGGAQCFTAGSGIVHSEMPVGEAPVEGLQLWVNLALADKALPAAYQAAPAESISSRREDLVTVREIVAPDGPVRLHTPVVMRDLHFEAGGSRALTVDEGEVGLLYVLQGPLYLSGQAYATGEAVTGEGPVECALLAPQGGRAVLLRAMPHGEPIRQHGPYVD